MENQTNDAKNSWIKKNQILVFILFWGFWALLVWSPWVDKTYTPNTTSSMFSSEDCKRVKYMSGAEIYSRARADGMDVSLEVANKVADELNKLPDC